MALAHVPAPGDTSTRFPAAAQPRPGSQTCSRLCPLFLTPSGCPSRTPSWGGPQVSHTPGTRTAAWNPSAPHPSPPSHRARALLNLLNMSTDPTSVPLTVPSGCEPQETHVSQYPPGPSMSHPTWRFERAPCHQHLLPLPQPPTPSPGESAHCGDTSCPLPTHYLEWGKAARMPSLQGPSAPTAQPQVPQPVSSLPVPKEPHLQPRRTLPRQAGSSHLQGSQGTSDGARAHHARTTTSWY